MLSTMCVGFLLLSFLSCATAGFLVIPYRGITASCAGYGDAVPVTVPEETCSVIPTWPGTLATPFYLSPASETEYYTSRFGCNETQSCGNCSYPGGCMYGACCDVGPRQQNMEVFSVRIWRTQPSAPVTVNYYPATDSSCLELPINSSVVQGGTCSYSTYLSTFIYVVELYPIQLQSIFLMTYCNDNCTVCSNAQILANNSCSGPSGSTYIEVIGFQTGPPPIFPTLPIPPPVNFTTMSPTTKPGTASPASSFFHYNLMLLVCCLVIVYDL